MVEVSLALLISAIAAIGTQRELARASQINTANLDADTIAMYRNALQQYTDEFYGQLQFGNPITKGTVTLPVGATPGSIYNPTITNLIDMGYLPPAFAVNLLTVNGGNLVHTINLLPAGCVGLACTVEGLVYVDRPILANESGAGINGVVIGQMVQRIGGAAGASVDTVSGVVGATGSWAVANPLPGTPAGVFAARFGSSMSSLSGYVRMNETRDPNFQNDVTVGGTVRVGGSLNATGPTTLSGATTINNSLSVIGATTAAAITASGQIKSSADVGSSDTVSCLRAALTASGNILSNSASCLTRVSISNSGVDINSPSGVSQISLSGDTGTVSIKNAAGAETLNADGASGRLTSQRLVLQAAMTAGSACSSASEIVQDSSPTGTVLMCRGGVWKRPGLDEQVLGAPCGGTGTLAQTSSSEALICRSGAWRLLNDRVSALVAIDIWSGNGNGVVPAPACGTGGLPDVSVSGLQGGADYGGAPPRNRFEFRVTGSGPWSVSPVMVDPSGNSYGSNFAGASYDFGWTATTYCRYAG